MYFLPLSFLSVYAKGKSQDIWSPSFLNAECHSYTAKDTCIGKTQAGEACLWCTSVAVPSTCYTESDAARLPSAVFQCDKEDMNMNMENMFKEWGVFHGKQYNDTSVENYETRFGIFQESVMLVTEHNAHASEHSYTLELNEFADTSAEEFRKTHFGNSPQDCSATHTGPYVVVLYNHYHY